MKKQILLFLTIIFSSLISFAQKPKDLNTINTLDTLVFDLSQAVETSGYVEFPVYFLSNDTVNAVDFSLKFNETNFSYDTILKLASYLTVASNYDIPSSTVYFTSFSIQQITNNTPLLKVRFTVLLPEKFCTDDLNNVLVYLNGDPCSVKIVECIQTGIGIHDIENKKASIDLFPNPSGGLTRVRFHSISIESYNLIVSDVNGKMVYNQSANSVAGENEMNLNLEFLSKGVYLVQVVTPTMHLHKKIVFQ